MQLEIKNLSNNTLLEPDEIVIEELYTVKEKMDYSEVISNIKSIKYMIKYQDIIDQKKEIILKIYTVNGLWTMLFHIRPIMNIVGIRLGL